ncbi:MAG: hypothetical protein KJN82_05420 [Bacteroidia bacterium]|nr:hypothetical protein [Bacteroidia bacterium]
MRIFTYILTIIAIALIAFNITKLDFNNLFEGESKIAVITIVCGLCAIILLAIIRISRRIEEKAKNKKS